MEWLTTTSNIKYHEAWLYKPRNLWKIIMRRQDSIWKFEKGYRKYE